MVGWFVGSLSSHAIPTGSQPTAIASVSSKDLVLVSTGEAVDVIVQGKKIGSKSFKGEKVLSVAVGEQSIAVGTEVCLSFFFGVGKIGPLKLSY